MTDLTITRHSETRMAQRGIRETDLTILLTHGAEIGRNRIMLRKRDAADEIRSLKKRIADLERLKNKVLVVSDSLLVTAYHQTKPIRTRGRWFKKSRPFRMTNTG